MPYEGTKVETATASDTWKYVSAAVVLGAVAGGVFGAKYMRDFKEMAGEAGRIYHTTHPPVKRAAAAGMGSAVGEQAAAAADSISATAAATAAAARTSAAAGGSSVSAREGVQRAMEDMERGKRGGSGSDASQGKAAAQQVWDDEDEDDVVMQSVATQKPADKPLRVPSSTDDDAPDGSRRGAASSKSR